MNDTRYYEENKPLSGYYIVTFLVKETGKIIDRGFLSAREAENFARKLKYSKKCELLSCPLPFI